MRARLAELSGLDRILLGTTPEIAALRRDVLDMATTAAPVLLQGETGTGKELVARALHDLSPRADAPFLALNCAAIAADRFEAEMFGTAGEATGRLVAASGGTLFLDEVCACPAPVQAKLLRVIEEQEVTPSGAPGPVRIDLRVVSASNEDTGAAVEAGHLRQDLLFRLNTVVLTLPPLRQRRDDLVLLFTHFLDHSARVYEVAPPELDHDDMTALLAHDWPGNVRELDNVIERAIILTEEDGIGPAQLGLNPNRTPQRVSRASLDPSEDLSLEDYFTRFVMENQDSMTETELAQKLGISRKSLWERRQRLGIPRKKASSRR